MYIPKGSYRIRRGLSVLLIGALLLPSLSSGVTLAHDGQHGGPSGHLPGTVANVELIAVEEVTQTEGIVADVAVSPDGPPCWPLWAKVTPLERDGSSNAPISRTDSACRIR